MFKIVKKQLLNSTVTKVVDAKTACDTLVSTESLKFIMGTRPLSEYSDFVEELKALGAESVEEIYNEAYQSSLD